MQKVTTDAFDNAKKILVDDICQDIDATIEDGRALDENILLLMRRLGNAVLNDVLDEVCEALLDDRPDPEMTVQRHETVSVPTLLGWLDDVPSPYLLNEDNDAPGWRPMKVVMGIHGNQCTPCLDRVVTSFGADVSYQKAADAVDEHYGVELGKTTVRSRTVRAGKQALSYVDDHRRELADAGDSEPSTMVVELDGCHIRTRADASDRVPMLVDDDASETSDVWREVFTGMVRPLDGGTRTFVCRIDDYPSMAQQLRDVAVAQGLTEEATVVAPADGAFGLRDALDRRFDDLEFILDFPHLQSHVYETADTLPFNDGSRDGWVNSTLDTICRGDVESTLETLDLLEDVTGIHRVRRLRNYLHRFDDCVDYDRYVANGWPIACGEIESAHRYIPQARLKLPGACWHIDNVNPMLSLRELKANGWWEDFWSQHTTRMAA
jgi:hypothetical protein